MKKTSLKTLVFIALFILSGCNTQVENDMEEIFQTESEREMDKADENDASAIKTIAVTSLKSIMEYDMNNTVREQTQYEYGDDGNIQTITVFDLDRNVYGKTEYIYGEDGVEWIVYGADGEIDCVTEIKKGRFEKESFRVFIDTGELFAPHGIIQYDRDNGQFIVEAFLQDGRLREMYLIYDNDGNLIKTLNYEIANGNVDYSNGYGEIYSYGPHNTMIFDGVLNGCYTPHFTHQYEYDGNNNVSKITILFGNEVVGWYEYSYDSNGALTKRTLYGEDGSFQYIEEYDVYGNVISKRYDSTYYWYRYEYDSNNNLIKRVWYDNEGNELGWTEYEYVEVTVEDTLFNRILYGIVNNMKGE